MATTVGTGNLISLRALNGATQVVGDFGVPHPIGRDLVAPGLMPVDLAAGLRRRRRMSRESGRAIEMLAHAIEYLADEFSLECMSREWMTGRGQSARAVPPQIEAIHLLMELNREIYLGCPEVPTLADRLRAFLRLA
jgi:hypothetical protein